MHTTVETGTSAILASELVVGPLCQIGGDDLMKTPPCMCPLLQENGFQSETASQSDPLSRRQWETPRSSLPASGTWRGLSDYRDTSAEPILEKRDDTKNARRMI